MVVQGPVFHSLQGAVTILCLGADAVLTLVPTSGFSTQEVCEPSLLGHSLDVEMTLVHPSPNPVKTETGVEPIPQVADKSVPASKKDNDLIVTLVHGDVLVLIGDDFKVIGLR
jgi:hypothetical protein